MSQSIIMYRRSLSTRVEHPKFGTLHLDKRSFSVGEAEALLGETLHVITPPHELVRPGTQGIVSTYKLLLDQIVLQVKWPDGCHDYYTKSEVMKELERAV